MKVFWVLDMNKELPAVYGSIRALSGATGLKEHTLYHHFGRMKRIEYENDRYWIKKVEVITVNTIKDEKTIDTSVAGQLIRK